MNRGFRGVQTWLGEEIGGENLYSKDPGWLTPSGPRGAVMRYGGELVSGRWGIPRDVDMARARGLTKPTHMLRVALPLRALIDPQGRLESEVVPGL